MSALTSDEIKSCKVFFSHFDKSRSNYLSQWELLCALEAMGYAPTTQTMQSVHTHTHSNNGVDFASFLKAIVVQRDAERRLISDSDFLAAFMALGGQKDGSGSISVEKLRRAIKEEFGLQVKVEEMVEELGQTNEEGKLDLREFKALFS